jgi:hypothetical protein
VSKRNNFWQPGPFASREVLEQTTRQAQIQSAMKSGDIFKGIFGLAVRLLGLVFLYFGLSAVTPLLDLGALETAAKSDIITAILPIVFNLLIAWWLIGGGLLIRRAYPEAPGFWAYPHGQREGTAAKSAQPQGMTDMEAAEKKLAALVEKPENHRAS